MKIKKKYTFVPPCPRCGSLKTGYKVFCQTEKECNEAIYKGLLNGELVEGTLNFNDIYGDTNLFCKSCGSRWFGKTEEKRLTFEEKMQERENRGITDKIIEEYSIIELNYFERKKVQKELKKQNKKLEKKKQKNKQNGKKIRIKQ